MLVESLTVLIEDVIMLIKSMRGREGHEIACRGRERDNRDHESACTMYNVLVESLTVIM